MAVNQLYTFGLSAPVGYVLSNAAWLASAKRQTAYGPGLLENYDLNTALKQACFAAAGLGQFVVTYGGVDALDNGSTTDFAAAINTTVTSAAQIAVPGFVLQNLGIT